MDRNDVRDMALRQIPCTNYLEKARNGGYVCPYCGSGKGAHGTGAVKYYKDTNTCACHACQTDGQQARKFDVFDLIEHEYSCDYPAALQIAADYLGVTIDKYDSRTYATPQSAANRPQNAASRDSVPVKDKSTTDATNPAENGTQRATADYMAYYELCRERLTDPAALSYLSARGISLETAKRCGIGFDPAADPASAPGATGNEYRPHPVPRLIIPTSKSHYVGRRTDGGREYEKMNPKGGSPGIFHGAAIKHSPVIFVTEGAFDALSIEEAGGTAIAINSAANADALIKRLERDSPESAFILCLDNDDAGKKATAMLDEGMKRLGIRHITADICGGNKDPNDALRAGRQTFVAAVQAAQAAAEKAADSPQSDENRADDAKPADDPNQAQNGAGDATEAGGTLPGLLTYADAVRIFETADDRPLDLNPFPMFSDTAKISVHDTIAIAADTGAGKSSLAINFLNDLNEESSIVYFNLEMDAITVLRRLTAIHSGLELDRIEGYKNDKKTAAAVNVSLQAITSRKPLQVIQGTYLLEQIEAIVRQSTEGREDPTIVIIDHSLLVDTQAHSGSRYERFTQVSEGLRKMALKYNIILFVLLQQNRAGKATDERPQNSSLKESGSWENDATHIVFLWYDPADRRKKLLLTKNRGGSCGDFALNYWAKTQTYAEVPSNAPAAAQTAGTVMPLKPSKREKQRQKLYDAYAAAFTNTKGKPTLQAIAEAADVTTATVKGWMKEHGGFLVNGKPVDPAGVDTIVAQRDFVKITPADDDGKPFNAPGQQQAETEDHYNGMKVTKRL